MSNSDGPAVSTPVGWEMHCIQVVAGGCVSCRAPGLSFLPADVTVSLFFPPAQDPTGPGLERFPAAKEAHCPEDGPQSPGRPEGVKEAGTEQETLLFNGASSSS